MEYLLGYGLPSSLTPERIKDVLGFARSQERGFREALDDDAAFAWTQTDQSRDFYERLGELLRTDAGREAYAQAKRSFEEKKPKLSGRADFFGRLSRDCLRGALDPEALAALHDSESPGIASIRDCKKALARAEAWEQLAEFIWALSASSRNGNDIVDVLRERLEVAPFLEEVRSGLVSVDGSAEGPEEDGEAERLVDNIKGVCTSLDAERLERAAVGDLHQAVGRLVAIAALREERNRDAEELRSHISTWRENHAEAIAVAPGLESRFATLKARIDSGNANRNWLETVLDRYETIIDVESRYQEARKAYQQAVDSDDYPLVSSLADTLVSLLGEREATYAAIDTETSEPVPDRSREPDTPQATEQEATVASVATSGDTAAGGDPVTPKAITEFVSEPAVPPLVGEVLESIAGEGTVINEVTTREPAVPGPPGSEQTLPPPSGDAVDASVKRIARAIATEIERGRFGLAYHLALATPDIFPSANAIKLIACNYVTDERASVAAELPNLAAELEDEVRTALNNELDQSFSRGHAALIAAAALMPARIAPGGPVAQLLLSLETHLRDMPSLWALSKTAADVSMTGIYLPPELLYEDDSVEKWRERAQDLQKETNDWIAVERQAKLRFQAATWVWQRILDDWDDKRRVSLGSMFKLLAQPIDGIDINRVKEIADIWRGSFEKEIDRIDRENRNTSVTKKIDGPARIDLRKKIREALAFADLWETLIEARPDKRQDYRTSQVNKLRAEVRGNADASLNEIAKLGTPIAYTANELVERYIASFAGTVTDPSTPRMTLSDLLNGELLADPNVPFDETGNSSEEPLEPDLLLRLAELNHPDFTTAAVERARRGDFLGAEAALDFAVRSGRFDDGDANSVQIEVDEERARIQQRLADKIAAIGNRLDAAYARGVLSTTTFEQQWSELPSTDFSGIDDFRPLSKKLKKIEDQVTNNERKRHNDLEERLEHMQSVSADSRRRIKDAIGHGRFQVAEDFIERVTRGETLPEPAATTDRPFDHFFPDFVEKYVAFRGDSPDTFGRITEILRERKHCGPIDARGLSVDAARDSARLVQAWSELHIGRVTKGKLQEFMSALGFANPEVRAGPGKRTTGEPTFLLRIEPISERDTTQLPDFGSRAGGRYSLVLIRDRNTHEAIVHEAGERKADGRPPTLLLFLSFLDVDARRALAHEFGLGTYHPTVVLDEALLAFLATLPSRRVGAFFDCASAFTFTQPFDPDATEVPPELFFGRKAERNRVLAMSGEMTHLVYGGRRLGKTALLKNIVREFQSQAPDRLVLYINLKGTDIGLLQRTQELWDLLAKRLAEHGIVSRRTVRFDSIGEGVRKWLEDKRERRILLLVDEADDFLDADRQSNPPYRVLAQIKRLMDDTERRFKVVFSGLHNVQRAARDPNTPFAHFGEPVRIGPMLPEADGDEIENLIRRPIEALGYRFASTDSVIRIAAETSYYPALAQQFCKELLRHVCENRGASDEEGPPFTIPPETVDGVFDSPETRDRIRNLFSWTIQLDPRYEFLAYLIARQRFDNDGAQPIGVPIRDIRDAALREWPQGFSTDPSYSTFEGLLEEMVGLGILRDVGDREFAIRTRNLRMLLGNDDEIDRRFNDAKGRMPPPNFDPAQFRNTMKDKTLSSLTAGQEDRLLSGRPGVDLVFGTRLSGLDQVHESLRQAFEGKEDSPRLDYTNSASIRGPLRRISRSRKSGIDILLVDTRGTWNPEQIGKALDFVDGLDARNRTIRPVFLGGPAEAWMWLNEPRPAIRRNAELRETWLGPCSLDFARTWLRDREARAHADFENLDHPVDPPWPAVAATAAGTEGPATVKEAIDLTLEKRGDLVSDVLDPPQTEPALRVMSEFPDDPMTIDELSDFSVDLGAEMSPEDMTRVMDWAGRLGLVRRDGKGYRLDSTYAAGIRATFAG